MTRRICVKNLEDQTKTNHPGHLYCVKCGATYSAHRPDYFTAHPDTILRCCSRQLRMQYDDVPMYAPNAPFA